MTTIKNKRSPQGVAAPRGLILLRQWTSSFLVPKGIIAYAFYDYKIQKLIFRKKKSPSCDKMSTLPEPKPRQWEDVKQ